MRRRLRIGLAVSPDRLTFVSLSPRGASEQTTGSIEMSELTRTSLEQAFIALSHELSGSTITAYLCLLPPLVELKTLEMPRLGKRKLVGLLEGRAKRYFMRTDDELTVSVAPTGPARGSPVRLSVTAASTSLLEDIYAAGREAGWQIAAIGSGYDAMADASSCEAEAGEESFVIPFKLEDTHVWLHVNAGRACCVRRHQRAEAAGALPRLLPCGGTDPRRGSIADDQSDLHQMVATRAASCGNELASRQTREARIASGRRVGLVMASIAMLMLVTTGWIGYHGVERELAHIEQVRDAARPQVDSLLAQRDRLAAMERGNELLSRLERNAPDWAAVLGDLATHLPTDASIVWMHGLADSLRIEGTARDASSVLEGLRASEVLLRVRADAPFEREAGEQGAVERFRIAAEIRPKDGLP